MHYALPTVKEPARGNVRVSGPLRLSPVKSVTLCTPGREPWLSQPTDQRLVLALPRSAGLKQAAFPSSSSLISETPGEPVLQRQLHSLSTYYTLSIFLIQVSLIYKLSIFHICCHLISRETIFIPIFLMRKGLSKEAPSATQGELR